MSGESHDLRDFVEGVHACLARHALGAPGAHARWLWQDEAGTRRLGIDPYGCADAANLLYSLAAFPREPEERAGWVRTLRGLQDPQSGLFRESTHHPIHTTAHCLAALELFDAAPLHPPRELAPYAAPEAVEPFLESLAWKQNPWIESHRGAGLYAALQLCDAASPEWQTRYFGWLEREVDPGTGLLRRGCVPSLDEAGSAIWVFPHLAGSFHYLFNLQHARLAWPEPERLIDTCLAVWQRQLFPFCRFVGFAEVDWVYCLSRAARLTAHRFEETRQALRAFAARYVAFLASLDFERDEGLNDLHSLFGAVCALAELQQTLPGELRSERPLRLVLDRRPFI